MSAKNMIRIMGLALGMGTAATAMAQPQKLFVTVNGGASMPFGNYAANDYSNTGAGFATLGYNAGASAVYFISRHLGVCAAATYRNFGFRGAQNIAEGYRDDFGVDSVTVYVRGTNHTTSYMGGLYYGYTLKRLEVFGRAMGGYVQAHLAGHEGFLEKYPAGLLQQEADASTWGLQAGGGVRYAVKKRVSVLASLDYFYSKPAFTIGNINRVNNAGRQISRYEEAITGLDLNIGIAYALIR